MDTERTSMAEVYDPLSEGQLADPYPVYRQARDREPVFRSDRVLRDAGVVVVTRHADVAAVAANGELFSSRESLRPLVPVHPETRKVLGRGYPLVPTIGRTDGPPHSRVSVPLRQILSPRTGVAYEEFITGAAERLAGDMAAGDRHADVISALAHPLPILVILHMLGVPGSDQDQARQWSADWMRFLSTPLTPEEQVGAVEAMQSLFGYMAQLVHDRQQHPRDNDLVTTLAEHHEHGFAPLSEAELVNNLAGLLVAGHVTTTALIGHAIAILLEHRRYWDDIIASPDRIPPIVEEILRYRTPTLSFFRTATRDTVLGGVGIAEGEVLQLLYGSANHDEKEWGGDPETFDPYRDRRGARLMSFSGGIHRCIGAPLARAEARIALEVLCRMLPGLELAAQSYVYVPTVMVHSLRKLNVSW